MIKLKCPRQECSKIWDYTGKKIYYAVCPNCRTTVSIKKNRIDNSQHFNIEINNQNEQE